MLKRGLKQSGEGFVFTRDLRHRVPSLYGFFDEYLEEFAKNISCPHLLIKVGGSGGTKRNLMLYFHQQASGSPHYESEEIIQRFLEIYRLNNQFEMVTVEGSHHVHLNNPERVVPSIVSFLNKYFE